MDTTVFLIRHGATEYSRERRVAGRRDLALSPQGLEQAQRIARLLGSLQLEFHEILSSPLLRAAQTAQEIAAALGVDVARDPRLADFNAGQYEGMGYDEVTADEHYRRFLADPLSTHIPGGERLAEARDRAVASIEQALADNPGGANVVVVSHAGILRVLLAHYLGMPLGNYHRLRVNAGSLSLLRFSTDRDPARVLAINQGGGDIESLLR